MVTPGPSAVTRRPYADGMRAALPLMGALAPLGFVVGATVAESSVDPLAGLATAPLIFAASAQLVAIRMLDEGAAPGLIVATSAVVSLRLLLYGATMAPAWRTASRGWKVVACALLVEPTFALGSEHASRETDERVHRAYYLGAGVTLWVGWLAVTAAGLVLGHSVGGWLPHEPITVLALVTMAAPAVLGSRGTRVAVFAAAGTMLGLAGMPSGTGILAAGAIGVVAGSYADRRSR